MTDPNSTLPTRSAIAAENLSVGYGTVPVVHGLHLAVAPGEVVALMGSNGAGKSTTLMALAGRLPVLSGTVRLFGDVDRSGLHQRARRGVRYVSEERSIIRSLNTLDNLRLGPGPIDDALDLFPELRNLLRRPAGLLSGGEQQMLALGRALAGDARVLLVDEISLGLAPIIVERLLDAIRSAAARGVAVLLVEQQARAALTIAHRGCVLRRGVVVLDGPAHELRADLGRVEAAYFSGADSLELA